MIISKKTDSDTQNSATRQSCKSSPKLLVVVAYFSGSPKNLLVVVANFSGKPLKTKNHYLVATKNCLVVLVILVVRANFAE